jgi:CelD/BcsL family acetyltransferase involved in cellulose biosynthesis
MITERLDPISDARWRGLVDAAPDALVFHHPAWLELLRDEYGFGIETWGVREGEELVGGLPVADVRSRLTGRRLVALPFCDLCGPIVVPGVLDAGARVADMIVAERRLSGVPLDIHEQLVDLPDATPSKGFLHHVLTLDPNPDVVERNFTTSALKRGARKAEKLGLRVERRTDVDALDEFYALHLETRRHQGVPVQSKRFIRRFANLFSQGLGHVALVVDESGQTNAAAVFLTFKETMTYKYGASRRAALTMRPNNLLFLDSIRWGCAQGLRRLDLGRTDLDNPGLRTFKLSWGADERTLSYTWLSDKAPAGRGSGIPAIAQTAIRRGPPILGRAVGKALYRHVA